MRRDDLSGRQAPRWIGGLLRGRYGRTPFGEPRFRLVWAESRLERSGGEWVDWDVSVAPSDRGRSGQAPLRRVAAMRRVKKYPGEQCWLIE
ncbi:MAG: hypothetical protein ACRDOE_06305, partial [Streptosporangiaceae bacterium]